MQRIYENLFDLPSHLICVIGPDGSFQQTNIAQKFILGWEPEQLLGKPVAEFVLAEDQERTVATVGKLFAEGGVITDFRNRCRHHDGGYRWISWSGNVKDNLIYCIGTDITAQIQAEQNASLSEKQLSYFLEDLPLITWAMNADGSSLHYNKAWYAYTGITAGDLRTEATRAVPHPEDLEKQLTEVYHSLKTGEPYVSQLRLRRHDGTYRWHLAKSVPIRDEQGRILKWIGTSTDVHDQMMANQKLHSLFMQAPACITIHTGPEHRYIFSNELNNKLLGRNDLVGKNIQDLLTEKEQEALMPIYDRVYQTGEPFYINDFPITMDWSGKGEIETKHFSCVVQATRDSNGSTDGIMTFALDVSAQVEARFSLENQKLKAETANKAKSDFLAHMSHEIRSPLTAIVGFSELALELEKLPETAKHYLNRIQLNGHQLVNIIGNILDLSKAEATGIEAQITKFNLKRFLADTFGSLESLARDKSLVFDFTADTEIPDEIHTDSTLLRQILQNLLSNAIKFTSRGFVRLKVFIEDEIVTFEVQDSGCGISEDQRMRLFQPFSQGDSSMSRRYGGTGLGLLLSKKMAQALGGDVELIRTEIEMGATFRTSILDQKKVHQVAPTKKEETPTSLSQLKILLAEDLEDNQLLVSTIVRKAGASIDVANNGLEAVEKAAQNYYAVILMDIQMPVMDGYEAFQKIKANGFKGKILALTAHATNDEKAKVMRFGFDDYLTKPIRRETMLSVLSSLSIT